MIIHHIHAQRLFLCEGVQIVKSRVIRLVLKIIQLRDWRRLCRWRVHERRGQGLSGVHSRIAVHSSGKTLQTYSAVVHHSCEQQLVFLVYVDCRQSVVPCYGTSAYVAVGLAEGARFVASFQFQVERCAVVAHLAFKGLYGLVALHYLHLCHGLGRHVLRGLVILCAHEVEPFYVHFVYRLALIAYFSAVAYLYARHPFQHVFYASVLFLAESVNVIQQRVLAACYWVGCHGYVFQLYGLALQSCVIHGTAFFELYAPCFVSEKRKLNLPSAVHGFQPVCSVSSCQRVCKERVLAVQQFARNVAYGFSGSIGNFSRISCHVILSRRTNAVKHQRQQY